MPPLQETSSGHQGASPALQAGHVPQASAPLPGLLKAQLPWRWQGKRARRLMQVEAAVLAALGWPLGRERWQRLAFRPPSVSVRGG